MVFNLISAADASMPISLRHFTTPDAVSVQ